MRYKQLMSLVYGSTWAIIPDKLDALCEVMDVLATGDKISDEQIAAATKRRAGRPKSIEGAVAMLPLSGVIAQHASVVSDSSGGTSTTDFGHAFQDLMADSRVGAVVIPIHSPGGSVYGLHELSKIMFDARGTKPVIAVADSLAASAAYNLGTAVDELVVTPGGEVGSIGTIARHVDTSGAESQSGVVTTIVSKGKHKNDRSPHEPLTEQALGDMTEQVERYYDMFVSDVARNRGVSESSVRNGFGEGRVVGAVEAVKLGMADRIDTLDNVVAGLLKRQKRKGTGSRAAAMNRNRVEVMKHGCGICATRLSTHPFD